MFLRLRTGGFVFKFESNYGLQCVGGFGIVLSVDGFQCILYYIIRSDMCKSSDFKKLSWVDGYRYALGFSLSSG
jgi:hypothetical protein